MTADIAGVGTAGAIEAAVAVLRTGGLLGLPTDTVYGLAADPSRTDGVFAAKDRPRDVVLPVLVSDLEQAEAVTGPFSPAARRLAERWWPGALTIVVPRRPGLDWRLGGDEATVGLRCPAHPTAIAVCRAAGPTATTSANLHGRPPATTAEEVAGLPGVTLVLDAGPCPARPSTVVSLVGAEPVVLREGPISAAEIAGVAAGGRHEP